MGAIQICLVLLAALLVNPTESSQKHNVDLIINANNQFTSIMYRFLRGYGRWEWREYKRANVFFSPISLHTALSMLHQGARGKTLSALSSSLKLPNRARSADGFEAITWDLSNMKNVTLEVANKLYIKTGYSAKRAFKGVVVNKFNAAVESIDFARNVAAAKTINTWIEKKTHNKIKDLISADDFNETTRSVIVNAIYFKGDWLKKFNKSKTEKRPFYTSSTNKVEVDFMQQINWFNYRMDRDLDAQLIELPYANKILSMVIVLPNKRTGISELETKLANYNLSTLLQGMDKIKVEIAMPKFKIEMKIDFEVPLKKSGLSNIFNVSEADLSGLLDSSESFCISKVVQKAFIEVNEGGSEAAAATHVPQLIPITMVLDPPEKYKRVILDHPFIFAIRRTRNTLFFGRVTRFD